MKKRMRKLVRHGAAFLGCMVLSVLLALLAGGLSAKAYVNTWGVAKDTGGANIRQEPSTSSKVIASIKGGDRIEICGTQTGADGYTWYKVYVNGRTVGYVRSDLITDTGEKTGGIGGDANQTPAPTDPPAGNDPAGGTDPGSGDDPGNGTGEPAQPIYSPFSDATLQMFAVSEGIISPAFSPDILNYTVSVDKDTAGITVSALPTAESASVSEKYGFVNLKPGSNMAVVTVQAADGTRKSYLFIVNRGEASSEIHYAVPGEDQEMPAASEKTAKKGKSHTGLIVFLVIVVIIMAAVMVMMALCILQQRRNLYGEGDKGFHISEIVPFNRVFKKKDKMKESRDLRRSKSYRVNEKPHKEEEDDDDEDEADYPSHKSNAYASYSVSDSPVITPMNTDSLAGTVREMNERAQDGQQSSFSHASVVMEELDEDALEDIMERDETINDRESEKIWANAKAPENFLTPSEDVGFEFMDLDDQE